MNANRLLGSSAAMRAALEDAELSVAENAIALTPAAEGLNGAIRGASVGGAFFAISQFVPGMALPTLIGAGAANASFKARIQAKEQEIKAIAEDLQRVYTAAGKEAVKSGKLTEKSYKENIEGQSIGGIVASFLGGFTPFLNVVLLTDNGSKLEDLSKKLKTKERELKEIIDSINGGKPANESDDPSAAAVAAEPAATAPVAGTDGAAASGTPAPAAEPVAAAPAVAAPAAAATDPAAATPAVGAAPAAAAPEGTAAAAPAPGAENTAGAGAAAAASAVDANNTVAAELDADRAAGAEIGADLAQADKQAVALESLLGEVGMLGRVALGLEGLRIDIERTKDFGGPSVQTATMYASALESLCVVIEVDRPYTPSLEDDSNAGVKIDAANQAVKENKSLVDRILATIRAGLARAAEWLQNVWKFVSSARARALSRATKLQGSLAAAQYSTEKVGGSTANNVKNTADFVAQLVKFGEITTHFAQPATYNSYIKLMETAVTIATKPEDNSASVEAIDQALAGVGKEFGNGLTEGKSQDPEVLVFEGPATGGAILTVSVPVKTDKIGKMTAVVNTPKDAPKVESVDPVNQAQAGQLVKQVVDVLTMLEKTSDDNGLKGVDDRLNAVTARLKNGGAVPADPEGRIAKAMNKVAGLMASRAKLPVYAVARAYTAAANTALDLVAASIGQKAAEPASTAAPAAGAAPAAAAA